MKTDAALPDELDLGAGVDAALSERERQELEELGTLLRSSQAFDLTPTARARGRAELELLLQRRDTLTKRRRVQRPWLWIGVPLAAAVLFAWLDPRGLRVAPSVTSPPELTVAQSAVLTAELTGAPAARDDLDRATRAYRKRLLATLEKGR